MKLISTEYVNKEAVKGNHLLLFLYIIATPLSRLFVWLKITPNQITWGSIVFTILAFLSLVFDEGYVYFCISWGIAAHLDFCDGTVARMSNKVNKTSFRFDHMSDMFKISLVLLGVGIHYNTTDIWILSIVGIFSLLYSDILNHSLDLHKYVERKEEHLKETKKEDSEPKKESLKSKAKNSIVLVNLVTIFGGINGHTLIFFLILPFGVIPAKLFLIYFSLLALRRSIIVIFRLMKLPKLKKIY